ncbi:magnesium transporter [Lachnospiraceae bacterium]|nr:magnesium transporter [Lachnospiraceae bacterium]
MIRYFYTEHHVTTETESIKNGTWIELTDPTEEEARKIASKLKIDIADVMAAIDPEEKNRIELQEGYTLILVDIPALEVRHGQRSYTTIPLGILLTQDEIVTVCSEVTPILAQFERDQVRDFSTKKKLRFVYQILLRTSIVYQKALQLIDRRRSEIEGRIDKVESEEDLIRLHELETTLVYFATSLRGNGNVLDRLTRYKRLQQFPEDRELLDDVIVENKQAIEMTAIYRDITDSTRELLSNVMDARLNNVMKRLTSITLILAIPTMISGMYGMNVDGRWMPLAGAVHGFGIIILITIVVCILLILLLHKKKML